MTIDVWMQHPNADFIKNPVFDSLRRWRPGAWSESSHPIEATLAEMDKAGVTCGMLCAWWGPSGPMISNDEVAHYCRAHPDRFIVIAVLRAYALCRGYGGCPPMTVAITPLFAECCELDIPFCTQVGHVGPLRESEPGRPIPYLDRVALEFPELRIVGGHIGVP